MKAWLKILFTLVLGLGFLPFLILGVLNPKNVYALPQHFFKEQIASGFNEPTDLVQTPDGRIFITEKSGRVKVVQNNQVISTPAITLPVNSRGERGLLGITLDPQFNSNKFVYLFYVNDNPFEYHVSRFTESNNKLNNEVVLYRTQPNINGSTHLGGGLRFGPDGKIWFTIGENTLPDESQKTTSVFGKLMRINADGTIPSDNPFFGQADKKQEIWAYGLRNPFRFNFLPNGAPVLGDVGGDLFEEVNIGVKGGNYGWPICEGTCSQNGFTNPVYQYSHASGNSGSISGGFIYGGNQFPEDLKNRYFFGDYVRGYIHTLDASFKNEQSFDDGAGTVVSMQPGIDGSLYFITIYPGSLFRVKYSLDNQPPVAQISANPTNGYAPLQVNFSSNGSADPDGQNLSYKWDFGDGGTSTDKNPTHTYNNNGAYQAKLVVSDGQLDSGAAQTTVTVGNAPPQITFTSPQADSKYNAGDTINYSATAIDKEDGDVSAANFSWSVIFHHLDHIHPYLGPVNGVKSGQFKINDTTERSPDTYYEIVATVKDSGGLSTTKNIFVYPNKVNITINSSPVQNMVINLNGIPYATQFHDMAVVNFKLVLEAMSPITRDGKEYEFDSWSDGGAQKHTVTIPSGDVSYTANYKPKQQSSAPKYSVIAGDVKINGKALYDSDGTSGLVVLMEENAEYEAPWGASVIPNPDLQTAENTFEQVKKEIKDRGCGSTCASVTSIRWPSQAPVDNVVTMTAGEKKNFEKYSVIAGDVKVGGKTFFDSDEHSGLVVLMSEGGEVEAPWGATVYRNGSLDEAQKLQAVLSDKLKQSGCGGQCQTTQTPTWP